MMNEKHSPDIRHRKGRKNAASGKSRYGHTPADKKTVGRKSEGKKLTTGEGATKSKRSKTTSIESIAKSKGSKATSREHIAKSKGSSTKQGAVASQKVASQKAASGRIVIGDVQAKSTRQGRQK